MTSHELAAKLLQLPDLPVCTGSVMKLMEVSDAFVKRTPYNGAVVTFELLEAE